MKEPKINLELEYLLLHEILSNLRFVGMTIKSSGSDEAGMVPIYDFQLKTASLEFGTLVDMLNAPKKYKNLGPAPLEKLTLKIKEISQAKFSFEDVNIAVETLHKNHDVDVVVSGLSSDAPSRRINLLEGGVINLNAKTFLKLYLKERNEQRSYESIIKTNKMMALFTGVLAVAALIEVIKFILAQHWFCGQ